MNVDTYSCEVGVGRFRSMEQLDEAMAVYLTSGGAHTFSHVGVWTLGRLPPTTTPRVWTIYGRPGVTVYFSRAEGGGVWQANGHALLGADWHQAPAAD